jgi:hypothetical protein
MSASILPFIRDTAFGPEAVASMGEAFDRACTATAELGRPFLRQAIIAKRIIEFAKAGERRPQVLCDRAWDGLGVCRTNFTQDRLDQTPAFQSGSFAW